MTACEALATKAELRALEQKLTTLVSQKIDKGEKDGIINAASFAAVGIVIPRVMPDVQKAIGTAFDAKNTAFTAKDAAAIALDLSSGNAQKISQVAGEVRSVRRVATEAKGLAKIANGVANSAMGVARAAGNLARFVNGKIDDAIARFTRLFNLLDGKVGGALSEIAKLGGRVASILGKIFFILDLIATLATIAQLIQLTIRVDSMERQLATFNKELDRIQNLAISLFKKLETRVASVESKASDAIARSKNAFDLGFKALGKSFEASQNAATALKTSVAAARDAAIASAVATAVSLTVGSIAARIPGISQRADTALDRANQALNRTNKGAGQRGLRGFPGKPGRKGDKGDRGERGYTGMSGTNGKNGKPGTNGVNGLNGKDGKDVQPQDLSEIKRLLNKIDKTTVKTDSVTVSNLVVSKQTNGKVGIIERTLNTLNEFTKVAFRATRIDKVLNALNTMLLLHNAAILSANLGQTLGELTSQSLAIFGIKDENNNALDINAELGRAADNFMKGILGEEVWNGTKQTWLKASRIVQSASNIVWTIRSMADSTKEITEWIAENTGKIGNALKRYRVVGENAYKWLPERVTYTNAWTRKIDRVRDGVDTLDDAASSLMGVTGEVQNIQEEFKQLDDQKKEFDKNVKELTPSERDDNQPVKEKADARKQASANPDAIENVERGMGEVA
jgi:Collagen triple helix repeat (20 copies)